MSLQYSICVKLLESLGLIYVIVQLQKIRICVFAWRKVLPTENNLVVSFWTFFQISRQPRSIRKKRNHQNFVNAGVSF